MFYLYFKSLRFPKDSVSQASQERSSLIYYKLNGYSISPSSFLYLLKIFHRDFPYYPISISRVPFVILKIPRCRLQYLANRTTGSSLGQMAPSSAFSWRISKPGYVL